MQTESVAARGPHITVDSDRLTSLRDAHGIRSDTEFARRIGVDDSTLRRVRRGEVVPSNEFLAKLAIAFPHASLDALYRVVGKTETADA